MYFNFKKFLIYFFALTVMLFSVSGVVLAAYNNYGLDDTVSQGSVGQALQKAEVDASPGEGGQFLSTKVGQIIGTILSFIGVIFMILIIYAGILWMTASGNEKNVDKAKSLIMSAIIGLIIVLAAYAITAFVGRQLTSGSALPAPGTASTTGLTNPQ